METRINIYLNGETFTKDGTDELVDYFLAAVGESISSEYEKRTVIKGNEEIKNYYFYTVDQEDLL